MNRLRNSRAITSGRNKGNKRRRSQVRQADYNVAILCSVIFYFVPAIVAGLRDHRSVWAIFVLDLLLGWTVLGWIVALVWSFTGNVEKAQP